MSAQPLGRGYLVNKGIRVCHRCKENTDGFAISRNPAPGLKCATQPMPNSPKTAGFQRRVYFINKNIIVNQRVTKVQVKILSKIVGKLSVGALPSPSILKPRDSVVSFKQSYYE